MNNKSISSDKDKDIEDRIKSYIKKKKEENSALKKLLSALENAKKDNATNSTGLH
ncbi:MAG: hypothetical protein K9G76_02000 [Bacteroidales bacterium]|nr:hypothetical protein [Bacteroidales bacterium]MCF8405656.1 hypothetical protein [Bacteroidales bacterium]